MSQPTPRPTLSYEKAADAPWRLRLVGKVALVLISLSAVLIVAQVGYRALVAYRKYVAQQSLLAAPRPADQVAFAIPASQVGTEPLDDARSSSQAPSANLLFSRVMRASDGQERMVILQVRASPIGDSGGWTVIVQADLQPLAGARSTNVAAHRSVEVLRLVIRPGERLSIFNAQPDAADASHLTIRYQLDGQIGEMDGWLLPGGMIKLEVRSGALRDR